MKIRTDTPLIAIAAEENWKLSGVLKILWIVTPKIRPVRNAACLYAKMIRSSWALNVSSEKSLMAVSLERLNGFVVKSGAWTLSSNKEQKNARRFLLGVEYAEYDANQMI